MQTTCVTRFDGERRQHRAAWVNVRVDGCLALDGDRRDVVVSAPCAWLSVEAVEEVRS